MVSEELFLPNRTVLVSLSVNLLAIVDTLFELRETISNF